MIKMLAPLFALDPLFRRTFLLVVPCQAFGRIAASGIFTALEMCTTLARIVREIRFMTEEEVSFFCCFTKKSIVHMTFAGDWAVLCGVSRFVELRVQLEPSNVVWLQKWHHTISTCGKVLQAFILQSDWLIGLDSNLPDFLGFLLSQSYWCQQNTADILQKFVACQEVRKNKLVYMLAVYFE